MKTKLLYLLPLLLTAACSPQLASPTTLAIPTPATTPTRAATPTPTVAFTAPAIQQHFPLADLPGVGRDPYAVAMIGHQVYVANSTSNNIAIIQNDRVTKFIPVSKSPAALAADPAQNRLYVSIPGDKSVSLITDDRVTLTQNVNAEARALLFFENRLYVGLDSKDGILVLDPATLQIQTRVTIPNAFTVINMIGDPARHRVYANVYEKTAVIDSATLRLLSVFPLKGSYYAMAGRPLDGSVLISVYDSASQSQFLTAFDPTTGAARGRVKIGGDPFGSVSNADGSRVYVANSFTNNVSVIDPQSMSVVATITVGIQPKGVALDEKAHRLYVANSGSDSVSAIDTQANQVVSTIPIGMLPTAMTANENAARVYVANASTDSVYVIEGARVVKQIPVGRHPIDLSRDDKSNRLFVANEADRTLTTIDESDFSIRTTQPITRFVTTVAVDAPRSRIFVNDVILDLDNLAPIGSLIVHGNTVNSNIAPDIVRLNPNDDRIYALAWNGTPGSNSRQVTYSVDGNTLQQRTMLSYYGNTTAIAIDAEANRLYMAGTHPLAYTNEFSVFDESDKKIVALPLPARTTGMVYNPQTHHLFLAHAESYARSYGPPTALADNTIQILDSTSFGEVGRLALDSPGKMTRLGNTIYVTNLTDGSITLIQDVPLPAPPPPTPTMTPTPYPTLPSWTPGPPPATGTLVPYSTGTPPGAPTFPTCTVIVGNLALPRWSNDVTVRMGLGCPTAPENRTNLVKQSFENGAMFWREDIRSIMILFNDRTWIEFPDTWNSSLPEDSCSSITVAAGSIKPKRGFGKVWCDHSDARAKIGAATSAEHGLYSALTQRFERGQMFAGEQPNQVFVLYTNNTWD